jgi:tetratricopeptide (TPR) repeat protein
MSAASPRVLVALTLGLLTAPFVGAQAQGGIRPPATRVDSTDALGTALDAEDKGDLKKAALAYREVLQRALIPGNADGDKVALSLLGLERVWAELGMRDSIIPVVQRVVQLRPTDPVARSIQLRALVGIGRDDDARLAFTAWRRASGADGAPFREYARLLLQQGRAQAADSVLGEAGRLLGSGGALSGEVAQLHVALGRWNAAAVAFREALRDEPYLETSAMFALNRAPAPTRDSIRTVLLADPALLAPRRLLSSLELAWGEPRRAWFALASVKADDSTSAAWRAFGERAELAQSWLVARDAWTAVLEKRGDLEAQQRAAQAALNAGDAMGALQLVSRKGPGTDAVRARALLPIEIAALGELGRASEAQRPAMARPLVSAYLRAGDLARAKAAVKGTDLEDDDETAGWLALYDGDLATARKRLVRAATQRGELVDALGVLARTRVDQSPGLGAAFLALARRDSAGAAARFIALSDSVGPAAPALLSMAARLSPKAGAMTLWDRIVATWPKSPEAAEALLASARALLAAGDKAGAITRFETLLVDYPTSALAPQARRELERMKGQVPPTLAPAFGSTVTR